MRIGWPRRVSAQVLLIQVLITGGVTALAIGLFLAPLSHQLDEQAMHRALAIAQTVAAEPQVAQSLLTSPPTPDGPVQAEAERIRTATDASYIVVMDTHGTRWSHTDTARIGEHVSTDPSVALGGHDIMQIDSGTLGRSARGKVPLRDAHGKIVGAVSVGFAYTGLRARLLAVVPLLRYAGAALAVGVLAALWAARRLQRATHGLAFADISALLDEREAMLHGIREGVVALDPHGRIRLLNDEAQRLLGLDGDAAGLPLDEALPPGRTTDVLAGRAEGKDLLTVSGGRVLVANRMPTEGGGAVVTLRDRTELELLGRELDSTHGLLDALRAQDHEHANRLHTLLGLLELGLHEAAVDFVAEVADTHRASAEEVSDRVHDPLVAALLVGKAAIAAERGVSLRIVPGTLLPDRVVDPRDLVTVLGNLVDNALDAASGEVEVELRPERDTVLLRVGDDGPGVPPELRGKIFDEGWSTKQSPSHRGRGLGLALVRRLAERYGGTARVAARAGGGAVFTVVLPEALADQDLDLNLDLAERGAAAPALTGGAG
ncbi:sensor histidine kinase [Actinacidiphila bryophytorum]|uniref:sensor histidine kinase n=1 Tax=Actinacidiphila bryophytorum TaxID=1436133 RepID=UPI002176E590|nr:sensor histidine kinase [Actinacidiphila bryophytorum]UWE13919.1 sensor histidine kinase [Actinacidiphila bryophytorum]